MCLYCVDVSDDVPLPLMGKVQVIFNPLLKGTVRTSANEILARFN